MLSRLQLTLKVHTVGRIYGLYSWPNLWPGFESTDLSSPGWRPRPFSRQNSINLYINQGRIQSKISEGVQNFQGGALFQPIKQCSYNSPPLVEIFKDCMCQQEKKYYSPPQAEKFQNMVCVRRKRSIIARRRRKFSRIPCNNH